MAEKFSSQELKANELVFLQSPFNFIEKCLGSGEKIKIRPESLVAFSPSVSITKDLFNDAANLYEVKTKFIVVTGPGLIYMDMQLGNFFYRKTQITLCLIAFYIAIYLLMFVMATFE
mmetsp:Transcript_15479/g.11266  ORF Transcript_15479/g.11266 Transcript_15479/m.11266 type:complete len:117 (+) Transcript_15479:477-827(+)